MLERFRRKEKPLTLEDFKPNTKFTLDVPINFLGEVREVANTWHVDEKTVIKAAIVVGWRHIKYVEDGGVVNFKNSEGTEEHTVTSMDYLLGDKGKKHD